MNLWNKAQGNHTSVISRNTMKQNQFQKKILFDENVTDVEYFNE